MDTVLCPNCGKSVALNQAIRHQIEDKIRKELDALNGKELEEFKRSFKEEAIKKAEKELLLKTKNLENESRETNEQNEKLRQELLDLTKQLRSIQTKDKERELEMQKRLITEREKIQEEILKTEKAKSELVRMELQKKLDDTKKALDDAQRKSQQTSQQLKGEVLELNLEEVLKNIFVFDQFMPIPKGIEGADIWQKVRNKHGQEAGSILWEIKRTKAWSKSWLPKLREDSRKANASICIIVSDTLPPEVEYYDRQDGVWICSYSHAIVLTKVLRDSLLQIAIAKSAASHKDEKLREIYDYIISDAFKHKMEAHFESVKTLKQDLDSEKRLMERVWKKREVQIQRLDRSMSQMFGEIQGIAGSALSLPGNLDLKEFGGEEEPTQKQLV